MAQLDYIMCFTMDQDKARYTVLVCAPMPAHAQWRCLCREVLERFDLQMAMRMLQCPYLERRIQGVNDIKDMIDLATKKEDFLKKVTSAA